MDLIHYRGLSCHLACMVSIAAGMGVDYLAAFATLWSESDFEQDPRCHISTSRRAYANLEALGVGMDIQMCASPEVAAERLSAIPLNEPFIVGVDLFDIPWSPVRGFARGPHFFIARKDAADLALCFDPTYRENGAPMALDWLAAHAFEVDRILRIEAAPPPIDLAREAREIVLRHPEVESELLAEIERCRGADRKRVAPVIKRIDAMMNNRLLFQRLLRRSEAGLDRQLFDDALLSRWQAVKNGLYKATIVKNNEGVIDEVLRLFENLMREEVAIAQQLASS